ncbi:MAG: hypothetical protein C7B45_12120 [Sulfobacillus acidophilus]|uniref:PIG-L family deacetylase n=1 Tax=Sulfobacillus acidophilus TaxID=53633 RepID=A0A2T2WFT9_9FIRM|nr:MAG: hypothetical protein C7B45_12120 [Sulfobacillus acidophilus]
MVGGTLLRLAGQGHDVTYLICTDGSKGTRDVSEISRMQAVRQREQQDAGRVIGVRSVHFLNYIDGELPEGLALRRDIVRVIRTERPDVVLAWDPTSVWIGDTVINHIDHRTAGKEAIDAVYPGAGNVAMFPELGLEISRTREVWLYGSNHPNVFVDIESEFEKKVKALQCHVSQHYTDRDYLYRFLRDDNRWICRDFDNPVTRRQVARPEYVESFRRIALDPILGLASALSPVWEPFSQTDHVTKEGES